jgi:hypothetical protein
MCTRARPYGRAGQCSFGGRGVTVAAEAREVRWPVLFFNFFSKMFVMCQFCRTTNLTHDKGCVVRPNKQCTAKDCLPSGPALRVCDKCTGLGPSPTEGPYQ